MSTRPKTDQRTATDTSHHDPTSWVVWSVAALAASAALLLRGRPFFDAAETTIEPFATVAAVVVAGWLIVRAGWFERLAAHLPLAPPGLAVAWVILITALISGLINLDVAVVVGMPLALTVAAATGVSAGWLAIGVANVANAASFLLPTSNLTNLLVMGSGRPGPVAYLSASWLAWVAVVAVTTVAVVLFAGRSRGEPGVRAATVAWSLRWLMVDLAAMFLIASGLRAFLTGGITLPGGFALQTATGGALASVFNNLPAAALVHAGVGAGPWPAILGMGAGSNLLITGSVATVICRRLAREGGARFSVARLSAVGLVLLPVQLVVAYLGLRLAGAL